MFPILLFTGLAGIIAWAARPKVTGVIGNAQANQKALPAFRDSGTPAGFMGPPLQPEEERLLALLVLWAKDKKYSPGQKRFMTRALAEEIVKLGNRLGLVGTAAAILRDGPIPPDEILGRRGITVRNAIVTYAKKGKL